MLKQTLALVGLALSLSANAAVQNTLNGVDYEWLELTETQGLSRDQVELRLQNINDELYGYEYASRSLTESLLLSYMPFDGQDGNHGTWLVRLGAQMFLNDFGTLKTAGDGFASLISGDGQDRAYQTVDTGIASVDYGLFSSFFYGSEGECISTGKTCRGYTILWFDAAGNSTMVPQSAASGYDSLFHTPSAHDSYYSNSQYGSLLVRTSNVPVPSAAWLFSTALLGLAGKKRLSR
jgi:hypothetical protein